MQSMKEMGKQVTLPKKGVLRGYSWKTSSFIYTLTGFYVLIELLFFIEMHL